MPLGLVPKIPDFVDVVAGFNKALRTGNADVQLSHKLGFKGIPRDSINTEYAPRFRRCPHEQAFIQR